jgi:hypothetical protein
MADAQFGQEYEHDVTHEITMKYTFADIGTAFYSRKKLPPCIVTRVSNCKITDFDSGTTCTIDVGIDYDGTASTVADAFVDGADLTSGVALGSFNLVMEDSLGAYTATAGRIVVTLAETGTAATAGEAYVTVQYKPLDHIERT